MMFTFLILLCKATKLSTRDYDAYDTNIVFLLSNRAYTRSLCRYFPHLYQVVILDLYTPPIISHDHRFEQNNFYVISKFKNSMRVQTNKPNKHNKDKL